MVLFNISIDDIDKYKSLLIKCTGRKVQKSYLQGDCKSIANSELRAMDWQKVLIIPIEV